MAPRLRSLLALLLIGVPLACRTPPAPTWTARAALARPEYLPPAGIDLETKALQFEEDVGREHLSPEGLLIYRIRAGHPPGPGEPYGDLADGAAWTGAYLAAEAFRWAATRDPEALSRLRRVLGAVDRLYAVTNEPGLLARTFDRADADLAGRGGRWRTATAGSKGLVFRGDASRDQYAGVILGLGACLRLVDEPGVREIVTRRLDQTARRLLGDGMRIRGVDGKVTTYGDLRARIRGLPIGVNALIALSAVALAHEATGDPAHGQALEDLVRRGYARAARWAHVEFLGYTNPNNDLMAFFCYPTLLWPGRPLPGDATPAIAASLARSYRAVADQGNAWFDLVWSVFGDGRGAEAAQARAQALEILRLYPLDRRVFEVDLQRDPRVPRGCGTTRKGIPRSVWPLPPNLRAASSFGWRDEVYALLDAPGTNGEAKHSAADFLLAYWLSRYEGGAGPLSVPMPTAPR